MKVSYPSRIDALRSIAARCLDSAPTETSQLILELYDFMMEFQPLAKANESDFEAGVRFGRISERLGSQCYFDALRLVIGDDFGYMLSRSKFDVYVATVYLEAEGIEQTVSANSDTLALVGAFALALSCIEN